MCMKQVFGNVLGAALGSGAGSVAGGALGSILSGRKKKGDAMKPERQPPYAKSVVGSTGSLI